MHRAVSKGPTTGNQDIDNTTPIAANNPPRVPIDKVLSYKATDQIPIPVFYGKNQTGGILAYENVVANGYWLGVFIIGWGPINQFSSHKFSDTPTPTFNALLNSYTGSSTSNASVDPYLALYVPNWTSRLPGLAYVVMMLPPPATYTNGNLPDIETYVCELQGLLVRDHRLDPTLVTRYYSENVALCRADYWTSTRYGGGRLDSQVDWTTVDTAANDCDVLLADGVTKRFTIGIKLDTRRKFTDYNTVLRMHAQMWDVYYNGKWQMFVDKVQAPSSITFVDGVNIITSKLTLKEPEEIHNRVTNKYTDLANAYKSGQAVTEDPGFGLGTAFETNELVNDTIGCPSYDQAKRLSVWTYNREHIDRTFSLDVLYNGGINCVPGIVVTVTCSDLDFSNQLAIVKSIQDIDDLSLRLEFELYDSTVYSDVQQTTYSYAPPTPSVDPYAALAAPTALTVVETEKEVQPGIFLPYLTISSTPYACAAFGGTKYTIQVAGGTIYTIGIVDTGPVGYLVTEGYNKSYTIKAYTVNNNTNQAGSNFISYSGTTYNPSLVNGIGFVTYDNNGGIYFDKPPVKVISTSRSYLSSHGTSLVDSTKFFDGNTSVACFQFAASQAGFTGTLGVGAYVAFTAAGTVNNEIRINWLTHSNSVSLDVWISTNNGTTWTQLVIDTDFKSYQESTLLTVIRFNSASISSATNFLLASSGGTTSGVQDNISEFTFYTYGAPFIGVKGYRLTGYDEAGALYTKDIFYQPDSTHVINVVEFSYSVYTYYPIYGASLKTQGHTLIYVAPIASDNTIGERLTAYVQNSILSPTGADTPTTLGANSLLSADPPSGDSTQKIPTTAWTKANQQVNGPLGVGIAPTAQSHIFGNTAGVAQQILQSGSAAKTMLELKDAASTPNRLWIGQGYNTAIDGVFFIYDILRTQARLLIDTVGNITISGNILPFFDNTYELGSSLLSFKNINSARQTARGTAPTVTVTGAGTSGSAVVETGSADSSCVIAITPGGVGLASSGTVVLTFSTGNGAYGTNNPTILVSLGDGTGIWDNLAYARVSATFSKTTVTIKWWNNGVVVTSGSIYRIHVGATGK